MKHLALWMLAIGLIATGALAQEPAPIGRIVSLSGAVYLRPFDAPASKPAIRLSPRRDRLRLLHDGDQLQASQDEVVQILLSGKQLILRANNGRVLHPVPATQEELDLSSAILDFGKPGAYGLRCGRGPRF
jgi:hypothetical protein